MNDAVQLTRTTSREKEPKAPAPLAQSRRAGLGDEIFHYVTMAFGLIVLALIAWIGLGLYRESALTRKMFGWAMLTNSVWDVPRQTYGALPFIYGTLVSSLLSLIIAVPLGIGAAIFLTEIAPRWLATPISFIVEMLAAVPSVIFGLWGFLVLCPWLQANINPWLVNNFGAIPIFAGPPIMTNMLAAGVILAIMILPFITAVSREVIRTVPAAQREASLGLGATRWETIRLVVLRAARSGIVGAIILALGRAIGETMAVVMVIGNTVQISRSLLQPGYTMPALLANQFNEAQNDDVQRSALLEIALILFVVTLLVNAFARLLILLTAKSNEGGSPESPAMARLREVVGRVMKYGFGALLIGAIAFQILSDLRNRGAAGLLGPIEILLVAYLILRGVTRLTRGTPNWRRWRSLNNFTMHGVVSLCAFAACFLLGLLLVYVSVQGAKALNVNFFTQLPKAPDDPTGGMKNGIVGTLVLVALAGGIGIPVGLLGGIFLAEFGKTRIGGVIRFAADVLNGIPSVVIGMFAYAVFVLPFKKFTAMAGGAALGIMMIPTVVRTTEEMLRLVPNALREASLGLGATKVRTILSIVVPAARSGIITGIMLAIARIAGETAPLLFTAFGNDQLSWKPTEQISAMTMMIYRYAMSPYDAWVNLAWAGALVLLALVLTISLLARFATRNRYALR
jgi:phosphate transport system permease protein